MLLLQRLPVYAAFFVAVSDFEIQFFLLQLEAALVDKVKQCALLTRKLREARASFPDSAAPAASTATAATFP
jgi:hypothetical protein